MKEKELNKDKTVRLGLVILVLVLMLSSYGFGRIERQQEYLETTQLMSNELFNTTKLACERGCELSSASYESTKSCKMECECIVDAVYNATRAR